MRIEIREYPLLDGFVIYIDDAEQAVFDSREECEEWLSAEVDESWRDCEVKL